jgi:hypothetical protein
VPRVHWDSLGTPLPVAKLVPEWVIPEDAEARARQSFRPADRTRSAVLRSRMRAAVRLHQAAGAATLAAEASSWLAEQMQAAQQVAAARQLGVRGPALPFKL